MPQDIVGLLPCLLIISRLEYRSGKLNGDADGLSRRPHHETAAYTQTVSVEAVKAVVGSHGVYLANSAGSPIPLAETLALQSTAVTPDIDNPPLWPGQSPIPQVSTEEWRKYQREDPIITRRKENVPKAS